MDDCQNELAMSVGIRDGRMDVVVACTIGGHLRLMSGFRCAPAPPLDIRND